LVKDSGLLIPATDDRAVIDAINLFKGKDENVLIGTALNNSSALRAGALRVPAVGSAVTLDRGAHLLSSLMAGCC
jgi:hypothetical protein